LRISTVEHGLVAAGAELEHRDVDGDDRGQPSIEPGDPRQPVQRRDDRVQHGHDREAMPELGGDVHRRLARADDRHAQQLAEPVEPGVAETAQHERVAARARRHLE
jgi:hypothetical protein